MNEPFFYQQTNIAASMCLPSEIHSDENIVSYVIKKYLFQKAMAVFRFDLPESWAKDYFLWSLFEIGYVVVFDSPAYGVVFQNAALTGHDIYHRPNTAIIENEFFKEKLQIHKDCALIKLTPTYQGIYDIVNHYGNLLAECYSGEMVNVINSKLAYVFAVKNKASADAMKKLTDKVLSGEPAVVADKLLFDNQGTLPMQFFSQNLRSNFIAPEMLDLVNKIEMKFDTEIGIPTANTAKKTQMTDDEVNANNVETFSKAALWLETMQEDVKRVNEMFGTNISVDWRVPPIIKSETYGGVQNESNLDDSRII